MRAIHYTMDEHDKFLIKQAPEHLHKYSGPLDIVVDIGAHVGCFSLAAAEKGAEVYAIEPSPINHRMLLINIDENGFSDRIHPINLAVARVGFEKRVMRFVGGSGTGQRSLAYSNAFPQESTVMTIDLKHLLDSIFKVHGKIDYVKVDIEGAEWELLDDDDKELKDLIGRVGHWEVSMHPLNNKNYFEGKEMDYSLRMTTFMRSCGVPDNHMVLL